MQRHSLSLIALALGPLCTVGAQSEGDLRAFAALRASHVGSLTPLVTPTMLNRQLNGAQLAIRYGLLDEAGIRAHAVAASGIFLLGVESSIAITAGVRDAECTDCSPALMLGLGGDMRVAEIGDAVGSGSVLSVAVGGDLGYAQLKPGDDYAIALGIAAPITLSLRDRAATGMRIAPFFTPVFAVGQTSTSCPTGCDKSGIRWLLTGGIGVWNPRSNVSASIGVNQVMITGGKTVFGVNVILGGR